MHSMIRETNFKVIRDKSFLNKIAFIRDKWNSVLPLSLLTYYLRDQFIDHITKANKFVVFQKSRTFYF